MKKTNDKVRKRRRKEWLRLMIQLIFFIWLPSLYSSAFEGVKSTVSVISQGKQLEISSFVVQLGILCAVTILAGRYFCGWACAFGMLNDVVFKISTFCQKKMKLKLPKIPGKMMVALRYVKYAILFGIVWLCFTGRSSLIMPNSPWTAFSLIRTWHLDAIEGCRTGAIILALLIPGMALQERFFCQCFCPMGAVFSFLPQLSFLQLKRDKENCPEKCGACKAVCPVDLRIDPDDPSQGECIRCGKCSGICPRQNIHI